MALPPCQWVCVAALYAFRLPLSRRWRYLFTLLPWRAIRARSAPPPPHSRCVDGGGAASKAIFWSLSKENASSALTMVSPGFVESVPCPTVAALPRRHVRTGSAPLPPRSWANRGSAAAHSDAICSCVSRPSFRIWPGNLGFQQLEIAPAFGHAFPGHRRMTEGIGSALELLDTLRSYEGAATTRGDLPRCALCIPASLLLRRSYLFNLLPWRANRARSAPPPPRTGEQRDVGGGASGSSPSTCVPSCPPGTAASRVGARSTPSGMRCTFIV